MLGMFWEMLSSELTFFTRSQDYLDVCYNLVELRVVSFQKGSNVVGRVHRVYRARNALVHFGEGVSVFRLSRRLRIMPGTTLPRW
jgi:hypothetical protein